MQELIVILAMLSPASPPDEALEPWASNHHPKDVAKRHVEHITTAKKE